MSPDEIKKMSNKEIDIKIAELCGWKHRPRLDKIVEWSPPKGHKDYGYWVRGNDCPPNYSSNLNEMHLIESKFLTHKQTKIYGDWLEMLNGLEGNQSTCVWHASAHRKAVSFILTMEEIKG